MRLSAKILKNVVNVNSWSYASQAYLQEGQANSIYIQLVDLDKSVISNEKSEAFPERPMRYLSQAAAISIEAQFDSIDDAEEFEVAGTQPFSDDKSIWKFDLSSAQNPKSGNFVIQLTEDGIAKQFVVKQAVVVESLEIGGC